MRIRLDVRRSLDLHAIERGQVFHTYRCYARLRFREVPGWSDEYFAIVDTGAPFSVIPVSIWRSVMFTDLGSTQLRGIIPKSSASLPARRAAVSAVLADEQGVSPSLDLGALLVNEMDVPLILGWSGCLDRSKLTLDGLHQQAWLEF